MSLTFINIYNYSSWYNIYLIIDKGMQYTYYIYIYISISTGVANLLAFPTSEQH